MVAATVFTAVVGGWAWAGPIILRRLPLPDVVTGSDARCHLWVIGSSTVQRWESLPRDLPGWEAHNRGIGGAMLDQIDARFGVTHTKTPPTVVLIYSGENDINAGQSGPNAASQMIAMLRHIRGQWPDTPVFVVALKPSPVRWPQRSEQQAFNRIVADFAATVPGIVFVPAGESLLKDRLPDPSLFVDGVHMNDRGYRLWSHEIRGSLAAALSDRVRSDCADRGRS